ncbi:unnamed protein product [Heligmosomoides polygyrus]|uniref:Rho-GAP domain-containing protein n=1 Tax=Heligmosomoides polygyrus TaxID=6339 RepID=A0A3P8CXG3_HELPZ|nr:unnamed protein product [Heligmosomoides polygyrus]
MKIINEKSTFRYCKFSDASICVTTFNVNGKSPPDIIRGWFPDGNVSDFYAIGLQEMDLSVGTYIIDNPKKMEEWMECIRASLPGGAKSFRAVCSMRLVGIFVVLFQSRASTVKVSQIKSAYMATGISMLVNKLGNKGGTALSLRLNDTLVCFVNCHLAAGTGELERRNQDFRDISQITFGDGLSIYDHEVVFWFGDLNYRLKVENSSWSGDQVRQIASSSEFPLLFKYDQLREQQAAGRVFVGFQEPEILPFRPTYKYDVGTSIWDSSEKARVPAWCDRILWWTRDPETELKVRSYESVERILVSDHKPVRALFVLSVRTIDQEKADRLYDEAIREADRRANELLPQVSLSMTEVDFGEVHFLEPSTCVITVQNTGKSTVRFKFLVRPERGICAKWLQITPPHYVIPVGHSTQISLTVMIEKEIAWELSDTRLQDILVMNLEHGRDYFIPVCARYYPRCFGVTLEQLLRRKKENAPNLIDFVSFISCSRLIASISVSAKRTRGGEKALPQLKVPALALYSALMRLFDTLKDPLIPFSYHREIRVACSDPVALWRIVSSMPPVNASILEYLLDYLRELIAQLPSAAGERLFVCLSDPVSLLAMVVFLRNAFISSY